MTKIIALSVIAVFVNLAAIANARAQTVLAEVGTVSREVKAVQLLDNGLVKIYGYGRTTNQLQLSESNTAELVNMAKSLGQVELTTTHQDFVCMMLMMESPYVAQELTVLAADGSMRMILSRDSCAVADHTFPKENYDQEMAKNLKNQLIVLAHQLAND